MSFLCMWYVCTSKQLIITLLLSLAWAFAKLSQASSQVQQLIEACFVFFLRWDTKPLDLFAPDEILAILGCDTVPVSFAQICEVKSQHYIQVTSQAH